MDNNFINIDDLVRQRLGGAREPELPGAWSRMEALLDKDDRRRPVGFYWNRAMIYVGVAMLLAAVGVGGYELHSAFRGNEDVPAGSAVAGNIPAQTSAGATTAVQPSASNVAAATTAPVSAPATAHTAKHAATSHRAATAKHVAEHTAEAAYTTPDISNVPADKAAKHVASDIVASVAPAPAKNAPVHTTATNVPATSGSVHTSDNKIASTNATPTVVAATDNKDLKVLSAGVTTAGSSTSTVNKKTSRIITTRPTAAVAKEGIVSSAVTHDQPVATMQPKAGVVAHAASTVSASGTAVVVNKPAVNVTAPVARPSVVSVTKPTEPIKALPGKKVIERIIIHKTTFGNPGNEVVAKLDTISIDQIVMEMKSREAQSHEAAAEATSAGPSNTTVAKTSGSKPSGVGASAKETNVAAGSQAAHTTGAKGAPANMGTQGGNTTASISGSATGGNSVNNNITSPVEPVPAAAPATAAIEPAAAAPTTPVPAATTPATENKPSLTKKKHSLNMAEGLSRMFNDVKYKISGVQFAPGLTAGINGTFFGPNSFKGFQFGVTGAFELDDQWSLFAEVKYFNRVNNNYAMYDYYNQYTPSGSGYVKDSTKLSFSFSTLHSFELPVSIRYTAGRFSFFGGGNFLYALGVNTGGVPQVIPTVPSTNVSGIGNNATRHIEDSDFKGRFGVGYTVGINCMVTPNLSFDFRNVQTMWDNSKTDGAHTVSKELYKSPSLQFSLMYRLGKGKDKE